MKNVLENISKYGMESSAEQVELLQALRREFHASGAMQGLLARGGASLAEAERNGRDWHAEFAADATKAADALIAALDKPQA